MEDVLVLEKRGCNFWDWSKEKQESDLENFRLYAKIKKEQKFTDGIFEIEVMTHYRESDPFGFNNQVSSLVATTKYIDGLPKIDENKTFYCKPTKKELLKGINNIFGTNFKQIEIKKDY